MQKSTKFLLLAVSVLAMNMPLFAADEKLSSDLKVIESAGSEHQVGIPPAVQPAPEKAIAKAVPSSSYFDPVRYTLGADDVVQIDVLRHPEFSGVFPVNLEGKVQYKYVGDIDVNGMTKKTLEEKIKEIIASYVINPEVNVTILEFKSKMIYVLGEVGHPGKFYMRADSIPVREAVVEAGLPTLAAAMRRCRLITPTSKGKAKTKEVDLYSILYGGNLKNNLEMHAGDVLYVPATVMAKIVRIINPVTAPIANLNSGESDAATMATRPRY